MEEQRTSLHCLLGSSTSLWTHRASKSRHHKYATLTHFQRTVRIRPLHGLDQECASTRSRTGRDSETSRRMCSTQTFWNERLRARSILWEADARHRSMIIGHWCLTEDSKCLTTNRYEEEIITEDVSATEEARQRKFAGRCHARP